MVRRQTKEERKKIIEHNRKLGIINEDQAISYGSVIVKRKATLDDYDNQGYEDNRDDVDFGQDKEKL